MGTKQPNTKLKAAREAKGLSQEEVAKKVEVPKNTYQRWEAEGTMPQPEYRRKLSKVLEASLAELGLIPGNNDTPSGTIELKEASEYREEQNQYLQSNVGSRLLSIVDAGTYDDQRKEFEQIMEQFDAMNIGNPDHEITRRQAVISLATFPFAPPINLEKSERVASSHYELFLKECGASLTACEELFWSTDPDDLRLAFRCVCRYLVELKVMSNFSLRYRQQALELAAHCAILKARLGWGQIGTAAAILFAQDAMTIARESGDLHLQLSASSKLAWFYLRNDQRELALETASEGRNLLQNYKGPLPICIRGGTWSTLSVMQARNYLSPDTARKKAREQGPDNQVRYFMDFREVRMHIEQGQALYYVGDTSNAIKVYEQIIDVKTMEAAKPFQGILTEDNRLETLLEMARSSIEGKARDMSNAIKYWEAAIEGAKRLKHEGKYSMALAIYDDMKIAFPGEEQIHNLRDHFRRGKGWK